MKHRITFQRHAREAGETDDKGYPKDEWVDAFKAWAHREDNSGKEVFGAAVVQAESTTTFTVHYRSDIDSSMRIIHKGKLFEIVHVGGGRNVGDFLMVKTRLQEQEGATPNGDDEV
jgi:SPP1 family predicted phage head-tail adaptor